MLTLDLDQVWDLFEGKHMFTGEDPDGEGYSTKAHLAEVIGLLGPPPLDLVKRGRRSSEFFDEDGKSPCTAAPVHGPLLM